MQPVVRLQLLGPLVVETTETPPRGFGAKAKAMLCYLALEPGPTPKPLLETLLWPDAQDRSSLNRELTHIRKVIPNGLLAEADTVQLDRSIQIGLDTERFDTLLEQGTTDSLLAAVTLYRGEFMAGFDLENCPDFDGWLSLQRHQWHEQAVVLLLKLVDRRQSSLDILKFARKLLVFDPWSEEVHRAIMLMLGRRHQWSAALKQYTRCRQAIEKEFKGAGPALETQQLYERIEAASKLSTPVLPAELTPLIGRRTEIAQLVAQLTDPIYQQVTIVGFGGMGKTRLALATAKALAHAFLEGVYFVPLASTSPTTLAITLADALQIPLTAHPTPQVQLMRYLRTKDLLLVLDGFEHLLTGAGLLADILEQAPGVKILVTSRERLAIRGERLFEITSLNYPLADSQTELGAETLATYSALALFFQIARDLRPDFSPTPAEFGAIVQICHLTMGAPLALELAAATLPDHSCQEIAVGLEQSLRFLDNRRRGGHARQQSVWATLAYSWNLLTDDEQRVMRQLAVFAGTFPAAATQQVVEGDPALFAGLVNKFLLRAMGDRYAVHELIREFAREQLAEDSVEERAARNRHQVWFVTFLNDHDARNAQTGEADALRTVEREIANIRLAWEWAVAQDDLVTLQQALSALYYYYKTRTKNQEIDELFKHSISRLTVQDQLITEQAPQRKQLLGKLLWRQASALFDIGQPEAAHQLGQQSIALLQQAGALTEIVNALNNLALVAHNSGQLESAAAMYRECLALSDTVAPDSQGIFGARLNLGLLYRTWGRLHEAEQLFQDCWAVAQSSENQGLQAYALGVLGLIACDLGKYDEARQSIIASQTLFSDLGDEYGLAASAWHLGTIHRCLGEYNLAQQLLGESQTRFQHIGYELGSIYPRLELAEIARLTGDYPTAKHVVLACLPILEQAHEPTQIGVCYSLLGKLALHQQQWREAEQFFQQSLTLHEQYNCRPEIVTTCCGLGQIALQTGTGRLAEPLLVRALTIAGEIGAFPLVAEVLISIADWRKSEPAGHAQARAIMQRILQYPDSKQETKGQATRLLQWLEARLPTPVNLAENKPEGGGATSIESLIQKLLTKFSLLT